MRKTLIALAAGLLALGAVPAAAAPAPQERPWTQQDNRQEQRDDRRNDRQEERRERRDDRYGRWETRWGIYPAPPPRHWSRQNDWYRHVRACQVRYRSYNPRTDTFVMRRGVVRRCRL